MRTYRAGDTVEDVCRACKIDRVHSVIVVDGEGRPLRVQCDFCGSQHNFRGGPGTKGFAASSDTSAPAAKAAGDAGQHAGAAAGESGFQPGRADRGGAAGVPPARVPALSDRERLGAPASAGASGADLEALLRRIIRTESGVTVAVPAERWRDGLLVLRPGRAGLQEKAWPIETFFHKVVMIRNRLRALEQQVNAMDVPEDVKVRLQAYITACYGSLTSFNVLFADEDDQFKGSGE